METTSYLVNRRMNTWNFLGNGRMAMQRGSGLQLDLHIIVGDAMKSVAILAEVFERGKAIVRRIKRTPSVSSAGAEQKQPTRKAVGRPSSCEVGDRPPRPRIATALSPQCVSAPSIAKTRPAGPVSP